MQLTTILETKKRANNMIYVFFLCVECCLCHPNYLDIIKRMEEESVGSVQPIVIYSMLSSCTSILICLSTNFALLLKLAHV